MSTLQTEMTLPVQLAGFHLKEANKSFYNKPQQVIQSLTVNICGTFKKINPGFEHNNIGNPKRMLTKPNKGVKNDGYDNENNDYILYVHGILEGDDKRYEVVDVLGSGTFGQVVKCRDLTTGQLVAIKVIKNKPAYSKQGSIELDILKQLNVVYDPDDKHHLVRLLDSFNHKNHICLVFELLSINLYDVVKQNDYKGLSSQLVRSFSKQLLEALNLLYGADIIHCDLKPENILLDRLESPFIKVIDFGSACYNLQKSHSYIQSRFYRSPEVLIGLPYTKAIDMWSFGCVVAELFLGLPLFPGSSEYNQMTRIMETMGPLPEYMMTDGKYSHRYFKNENGHYIFKNIHEYSKEQNKRETASKSYHSTIHLDNLILKYPLPSNLSYYEKQKEIRLRKELLDFLKSVLQVDPAKRMTPQEAIQHPFITKRRKSKTKEDVVAAAETQKEEGSNSHIYKSQQSFYSYCSKNTHVQQHKLDADEKILANLEKEEMKYDDTMSTSPPELKQSYGTRLNPLLSPPLEDVCLSNDTSSNSLYGQRQRQR
ncbi:kinase-like protein [Backusella circina FSU 941]|nr:kinase-like protein [Backusella circina FSU 941]